MSAVNTSVGGATAPPSGVARLLARPPTPALADHLARVGPLPTRGRSLLDEIERSGLRGRGGAGFPAAVKLRAVADRGGRPVLVANGTEGEPASRKDKALLRRSPHLVIDGAVAAARAVGAGRVIICVDRGARQEADAITVALDERRSRLADGVDLEVRRAPTRYVTGEESALIHWLNGGDARPTLVPPRPFERGVGGQPTAVHNVETLAHIALIARYGADWFRSLGTADDAGTTLLTVGGAFAKPGVYEVPLGSSLARVAQAAATDLTHLQAVLIGGYFGTWITGADMAAVELGTASLRAAGAGLGAGVVLGIGADVCGLAESARIVQWLAGETAGQCGPCVNGLSAIAGAMHDLVTGDRKGIARAQLERWTGMVKGRGACKHPDGAARFVESSLRSFAGEIERHRRRGPCPQSRASIVPLPAHHEEWR